MQRAVKIISVILILIGGLWTLQGLGIVGGSFMTGSQQWLYIGIATVIAGLIGLFIGSRGSRGA